MSTAKIFLWGSMACLLLATPVALAQNGLRMRDDSNTPQVAWPRWQARFGLAASSVIDGGARWQLSAGQLLGDYYWSGLRPSGAGRSGGFRATSGLLLGPRSLALGTPTLASAPGLSLTLPRGVRLTSAGAVDAPPELWLAVPYLGVGYSGFSLRGGWGFTADVGVAGNTGGLRTRRDSALGAQAADDLLRELRLTPVLQVGASYAF
jgi:hypothetical protein